MTRDNYTFRDTVRASARLRRLAEIYEPEMRELLRRGGAFEAKIAVDLGCGPGWSTQLIREVLRPKRTVGLDQSERYVEEARRNHGAEIEFAVHDIVEVPFPVAAPDVMFCRFLLTHLSDIRNVLRVWASVAAPGALLFVHETESIDAEHPTLHRYYELVAELQRHYGQTLHVGAILNASFGSSGWEIVESRQLDLRKPSNEMAQLHLANLQTWRQDDFACTHFDAGEIDELETSLNRIASGDESARDVSNTARQIIAVRAGID